MNTNKTTEVIRAIENAKAQMKIGWCVNAVGRDKEGRGVGSRDPQAVEWCAYGALIKVAGDGGVTSLALRELDKDVPFDDKWDYGVRIIAFNNAQSEVGPVLEQFDKTLLRLRAAA